jgi:hypothetical protein
VVLARDPRSNPEAPFDGGRPDRRWLDPLPPLREDRAWLKTILLVFGFALILLGLLVYAFAARAHMHEHPELDDWVSSLKNGSGIGCCSKNDEDDGKLITVEQYVTAEEFAAHGCRKTTWDEEQPANRGPFAYCAYIYDQWWLVPENVVLKDVPNKFGLPVAFLTWLPDSDGRRQVRFFRCFMLGAGT